jgi:hypothetical protein
MIDIIRNQSSGVIACVSTRSFQHRYQAQKVANNQKTNLVRCSFAALLVSLIDKATQALNYGWTYTLLGGLSGLLLLCIYVEMRMGPKWRAAREKQDSMCEQQE